MKHIAKLGFRSALAVAIASAALVGCSDDDSSSGGGKIINVSGGAGGLNGGTGGDGYELYIYKVSGPGDIVVKGSGSANASFPTKSFTPYFGDNPAVVTADVTPALYVDCAASVTTATGGLYMVVNNSNLFISDGDATACEGAEIASGLQVRPGATLTLPINYTAWTDWAYANFDDDIENKGTITVADFSATQRGSVEIDGNNYIGSGTIETSGTLAGQHAGSIYVYGDYGLVNTGKMNANGADSTTGNGGDGGEIYLEGYYFTQNTADLTANGGDTTFAGATGGSGDYVELYTYYGPALNSGDLTANGGSGPNGGDAGDLYVENSTAQGNVYNSGKLTARGGDATTGSAGDGGYVEFYAYGGELRNSGAIDSSGGDTTGAAGDGGDGGDIYVYTDYSTDFYEETPAGAITWSGAVNTSGGDALATTAGTGDGGDAGYFDIYHYSDDYPTTAPVQLLGYSKLNARGGDGDFGGSGGYLYLYNYTPYDTNLGLTVAGGSVLAQLDLDTSGGDAHVDGLSANANGSEGGDVYLETDYDYYAGAPVTSTLKGNVVGHGGQARDGTGSSHSTYLWLWGYDGATLAGTFDADGSTDIADDGGTDGYGGHADSVYVYAELGETNVSGAIKASGGYGEYRGGHTDDVYIWGQVTNVSASVSVNGGDADPALAGSEGYDGGWLEIRSSSGFGNVTGTLSVEGGEGATPGDDGSIWRPVACTGPTC